MTFAVTYSDTGEVAAESCNHATTARRHALTAARESKRQVTVSRAGKPAYCVAPSGHILPPPDAQVDARNLCKRALGVDGACFCPTCRAERRTAQLYAQDAKP
jgi:hypothetical protein